MNAGKKILFMNSRSKMFYVSASCACQMFSVTVLPAHGACLNNWAEKNVRCYDEEQSHMQRKKGQILVILHIDGVRQAYFFPFNILYIKRWDLVNQKQAAFVSAAGKKSSLFVGVHRCLEALFFSFPSTFFFFFFLCTYSVAVTVFQLLYRRTCIRRDHIVWCVAQHKNTN